MCARACKVHGSVHGCVCLPIVNTKFSVSFFVLCGVRSTALNLVFPLHLLCFTQRGEDARLAHNTFFHLTYEGAVDIDAIDDPVT